MLFRGLSVIFSVVFFVSFFGCDGMNRGPEQTSKSGSEALQYVVNIPKNSRGLTVEQQNISSRIYVTNNPTKIMWIHILAFDGRMIKRLPVRCKVTSSGKRLEPAQAASSTQRGRDYPYYGLFETSEFVQADGTFGSSNPYEFWFDPLGRYHQLGSIGGIGYLLTDYPIDLVNPTPDEITGLYNMHLAAWEWQQVQEKELRKKEGKE